nr:hypothetical protein [Bradyrhizobium sp. CCH5-A9]
MAFDLILRRQNSRFVPEWDHDKFWTVLCQDEVVGAIVRVTLAGADTAWTWSIHLHAGRHGNGLSGLSGRADLLPAAMAEFRDAFDRAITHIGPDGWAHHVAHMAVLAARNGTKRPPSG